MSLIPNPTNLSEDHSFERYQRQTMVSQIGVQGQQKLLASHVAIVGMGGLGCPVGLFLAGAGVGKLTLIDHDTVSLTNLHRQVLYRESDVGQAKVVVAKQVLAERNSEIEICSYAHKISADNIDALLSDADVIVDATDNFALSYLLSDFCLQQGKPLVSASVIGVTGYVGVFCQATDPAKARCPSMRAVFPNPPPVGQDCNSVGVIGTASGMMGTLQAQEVIKVILGDSQQLAGRLLSLDLWSYRQTIIDFSDAPEPDNFVRIVAKRDIAKSDDNGTDISDTDVSNWVVDVRNLHEIEQSPKFCHQHLPVSEVLITPEKLQQLPKGKRLLFTCVSGQRALMVADMALDAGFERVAVLL